MNELQVILNAFAETQQNGETAFLATIVKTQGSTYRKPGARMLMTSTGRMSGTISGGCLEKDVFEHARLVMYSGEPTVVKYDTAAQEDIVWGFGLGCNGMVQVLIERLDGESQFSPIVFLVQCLRDKQPKVLATVFNTEGLVNVKLGDRLLLNADGTTASKIQDPNLTLAILTDAQAALRQQLSTVNQYHLPSGNIEVFLEVIQPPTPLVIFGAGRDAVPVAQFAKALGWHVTIVDCRAFEATEERFTFADKVILTRREIVHQQVFLDTHTVAVVMTHNYLDDLELLKLLLPSPAGYVGILGSKHRTERLLQDLCAQGRIYSEAQLQRLHAPVGMDIGADTPEEIAIAIIAEIQAVLGNCSGGMLKNRQGAIHPRYKVKEIQIDCWEKFLAVNSQRQPSKI